MCLFNKALRSATSLRQGHSPLATGNRNLATLFLRSPCSRNCCGKISHHFALRGKYLEWKCWYFSLSPRWVCVERLTKAGIFACSSFPTSRRTPALPSLAVFFYVARAGCEIDGTNRNRRFPSWYGNAFSSHMPYELRTLINERYRLQVVILTRWPLYRDITFCFVSMLVMVITMYDSLITWSVLSAYNEFFKW